MAVRRPAEDREDGRRWLERRRTPSSTRSWWPRSSGTASWSFPTCSTPPSGIATAAPSTRPSPGGQSGDTRPLAERSRYEQSFVQCINLWEDGPDVRPLTFHPGDRAAAAALLRVDAVRLWHDQALYKESGGRETDAHQDQPYWPIAEPTTVTAWVPFDGSTLASGAMGYLAGSHTVGLRRFVNIFYGEPEDLLADPALDGLEPTFVEVPAGSVAFHHGLTAHLAMPNTTDRPRRVHTMIYFADGCTRGSQVPALRRRSPERRGRRPHRQSGHPDRLAAARRRPAADTRVLSPVGDPRRPPLSVARPSRWRRPGSTHRRRCRAR